jgi:hypothetical protein
MERPTCPLPASTMIGLALSGALLGVFLGAGVVAVAHVLASLLF